MPRDLFGDVTRPSISVGSRKWYTVPLSLAAHIAMLIPAVLVPLLATDVLPLPREYNVFVIDPPAPPEPPPPARPHDTRKPPADPEAAPIVIPEGIQPEPPAFDLPVVPSGVADGVVLGETFVADPPPPPPPSSEIRREPVPVGGHIKRPTKIRDASPAYPVIAQAARVQGTVILEAVIDVDGKVQNLRVLRSIPLLDQAAIAAVQQWEYSPTRLNGVAVPVIMTVTVTFTLSKD